MNRLNKKMENYSFRKPEDNNADNKPYFQLATRKNNPPVNPQNADSSLGFFKTYSNSTATSPSAPPEPNK